ncbi:MAG TPA: ChbG/HpnK family deacetylase [Acidimicrobiales bacterium]|nr:ChbG/HpnK family deacetylase [Acidimicrobiales bacterium]
MARAITSHDRQGLLLSKLLIVNADDYGLTEGISRGILHAHREGIVTSTSAIAIGPAYPKVASWLADEGELGVGVHLAAVGEDPPLLSAQEIPSLVGKRGHLCESYNEFVGRAVLGRINPEDLRLEFTAQLESVQELGVPITHLDAHQHLQLWPSVCSVVIGLATRFGIPAVRVPRFRARNPVAIGVTVLGARLARQAGRAGLRFPLDAVGIECAGRLDEQLLPEVLERLARHGHPAVELTVHPGEGDDVDRGRYEWGYRWEDELAALVGPVARRAVVAAGFRLATYADLPPEK